MKKLLFLLLGGFSLMNAQCVIEGKSQVNVGEKVTYQVSNEYAQCEDCHQWKVVGSNATIEGDRRKNEIKLNVNQAGSVLLSLTMLTPNGVEQCSKNIDFIGQNMMSASASEDTEFSHATKTKVDCDINVKTFKEIKYEDNTVAFFPEIEGDDYTYKWEVYTVNGGEPRVSKEKVAKFDYRLENYIDKVYLTITSKRCIKKLSKAYNESFWRFLNKK